MLYIGIIGCGLVGKELLKQIGRLGEVQVVGVMNSKRMLLRSRTDAFEINENWVVQQDLTLPSDIQSFVAQFADSYANSAMVLVDCTSDESVARLYPNWLKNGFHVVTPNKKAFSGELSLYKEILAASQKHARFCYHESTVGAGLPVLETLKALVHTGDKIVKIEGIFSGTLSYLFNNFSKASEDRTAFSDIVKVAKAKGFTEPDPRDDLNGMDVARKVVILGRVAGLDVSLETLDIENIVPEKLRSLGSSSEFMERLSDFDAHFDKLNSEAASKNQVLRYVGMINKDGIGLVKLMRYPAEHPFACLTGSDNIVAFTTERFPSPLIIQGAGAGASVTVFGILSDLLKIKERA